MLSVILKILSVLGIILLVLLGIILLALLLVLFFPIIYRIKADREAVQDSPEFAMHADVRANWLFGLLRVRYQYPEPGVLQVKLLFFTIYDSGKSKNDEEHADISENADASKSTDTSKSTNVSKCVDNTDQTADNKKPSEAPASEIFDVEEPPKKKGLIEKIQYTFQTICDKIKGIFEKIKDIRENVSYYKEILLCEDTKGLLKHAFMRLGKILKSIRPRKLRADIRFGAESPDTTGYVCAAYGMICSYLGKHVIFTPDFEQSILVGKIYAAGHITVFKILWNVLMVVKDRRLWELKDKLTNKQ